MSVVDEVSKLDKFNDVIDVQYKNIQHISCTNVVLKFDKLIDFNDSQP